ncbi:FxLYD domain-containing protein [Streptomyces sp. NPDC058175]|uniref:FxLYD domain-containing protein n=1 Tax=Streptomyces sp. NPDC058175 TaxID=3346367 RepID=UPI0036F019F3
MSAGSPGKKPAPRRWRSMTAVLAVLAAATGAAALVSCSTDNGNNSSSSVSPRPTPPNTASFSGSPPSAMASSAKSAVASAKAEASAAASSASARASEFEASVSAEVERANAAAASELMKVEGQGNATADVALTGKPRSQTGGVFAVVVNITNRTDKKANYAVQVDFKDSDGKVVETRYVGAENLDPGERAQPLAISRKPPEMKLTAKVAKAQRY